MNPKLKRVLDAGNKVADGSVLSLGSTRSRGRVDSLPTGSIGLDMALGVGGLPKGRIIEIIGPEASGKTTLALSVIAEYHRHTKDDIAGIVDAEHALDRTYAGAIGLDLDRTAINQPDNGEQGLEVCESYIESGCGIILVDSVAALTPKAEIEGEMGDAHMGLQARLMSQGLRKLTAKINKSNAVVIFINQIREKIGVTWGSNETTTGGKALKFYASQRIDVRKIATIKGTGAHANESLGVRVRAKVIKNKVAPPFREAEFEVLFGKGIDQNGELTDLAKHKGILSTTGAWYLMDGKRMANGRKAMLDLLESNHEGIADLLRTKLWELQEGSE